VVVVAVAVVIVTAAAPIDDAPLYSSWRRVARGGVAAILCRAAGARRGEKYKFNSQLSARACVKRCCGVWELHALPATLDLRFFPG